MKRSFFVVGSGLAALTACAGGVTDAINRRSSDAGAMRPDVCVANQPNCGRPTPEPTQTVDDSTTVNAGTSRVHGSTYASLAATGVASSNGATTFSGTIATTKNSDNTLTTSHSHNVNAPNWPSSVSSRYTVPSTILQNSSFSIVDSNNNTITETVTTNSGQQTVVCSTTVKGIKYSVTIATSDNQNYTIFWTDGTNSGSTNLSLPQVSFNHYMHDVVASAEVNHGDFMLGKSSEEVAIFIDCAALARASELGLSFSAIAGAGALIATGSIFGIEAAPFLALFAAGAGLYGGVAGAIHAISC